MEKAIGVKLDWPERKFSRRISFNLYSRFQSISRASIVFIFNNSDAITCTAFCM